jgi:hypothetical protein|tara:strand:- start:662 stop:841 length:180 start_codon:yes stop_codon:yes gene_type:complete
MQPKFNNRSTIGQSLGRKMIKLIIICLFFVLFVFIVDKVNFPSPEIDIKKDITNEIKKL